MNEQTVQPVQKNFRILLIDDSEDSNESTADLLRLFDYEVCTAVDAEQALAHVVDFAPQLILSDIGLPGMDGYELAPALRRAAGERPIILAAVTGYGMPSDRARAQEAGFDHHLVKPLDAETLLAFVAEHAKNFKD